MTRSRRRGALLAVLLGLACTAAPRAQEESPDEGGGRDPAARALAAQDLAAARAAASRALDLFAVLTRHEVLPKLGFRDADDLTVVDLGVPIPVFTLRLDQLREYEEDDEPSELLTRSDTLYFPVLIGGEVRSSVTVEENGGVWTMVAIGQSHLTETLVSMRREIESSTDGPIFVVHVPSLYQMFLVHGRGDRRRFVPVYGNPFLKIVARQIRPSGELFKLLRSFAHSFTGPLHEGVE